MLGSYKTSLNMELLNMELSMLARFHVNSMLSASVVLAGQGWHLAAQEPHLAARESYWAAQQLFLDFYG